jgi:broad specificity phosphatase PhoE
VVTSPSPRARETADQLADGAAVTIVDDVLGLQLDSGDEGPLDALEQMLTIFDSPSGRPYGGESLTDLAHRSLPPVLGLARDDDGVAVVSHRIVNVLVVAECLGWDIATAVALQQDTGGVNLIGRYGDRFEVEAMNILPANPLLTGPLGVLPDTSTAVERRLYLVVPGDGTPGGLLDGGGRALATGGPAFIRSMLCGLLGVAAGGFDRARLAPGSVSIADYGAGRWWVRSLGYRGASAG